MKITYTLDPKTESKSYQMKDIPQGKGVYSDILDSVLVPVDNEYWIGFDHKSIGIIDNSEIAVEGYLVNLRITIVVEEML